MEAWLVSHILPQEDALHAVEAFIYERFRALKIVPYPSQVEQCINNASLVFEQKLFSQVVEQLADSTKQSIDDLIITLKVSRKSDPKSTKVSLNYLKQEPRQASIDTVLSEVAKLQRIQHRFSQPC